MINKIIDKVLGFLEYYLCDFLFFAMSAIIMIQIILRVTGQQLAWTEETARYLFVWVIYLAASKAVRQSKHLQVDLLGIVLKGKAHTALMIFANVASLVFFVILVYYGALVMNKMHLHPQYSAAMKYNMMIPYAAPFVGSIMMTIRAIQNTVDNILEILGKKPAEKKEAES